ncbi:MAG TPA: glucose-6-phosphate dehydrogenase assembly protein OpcA [Solirubrobacteraceae bacterium]
MARSDVVWSEQGTTPDRIEAALRELLIEVHTHKQDAVPARVLNMIAFVDRAWSGEIANRLRGVGRYHASRMVVLAYEPKRERLDARVTISSDEGERPPGELALLRETVVVELGDRHLDDLLTIADPLVVPDLPTLLWSPHGHRDIAEALMPLAQAVLYDSVGEPDPREALDVAAALTKQAYVVDLAWLRSTPWRERVAAMFDPPWLRPELRLLARVEVRHHPASRAAASLLLGWLASRLGWRTERLMAHGEELVGKARGGRQDVSLRLRHAPQLQVPGLEGLTVETAAGRSLSLDRGPGGLRARFGSAGEQPREWTIPGASRGETGVLGEGIRQALLRDPTYVPALDCARTMIA